MPAALFPGTHELTVSTGEAEIFARFGGEGPPLLLLHGFPQTHAMWHGITPELMRRFTCVLPDLRGYGRSSCPENTSDNFAYSKRTMAADMVALMAHLGHPRFSVCGHDRGGRVAYRLALDHPQAVACLSVLDIVPTAVMWREFGVEMAMKAYHWLFLAQPAPLPEMLISRAPVEWLDYTIATWSKARDLSAFDPAALGEYRAVFVQPHIHALCNDYRAGATYDRAADEADLAAGKKIACPIQALWGTGGFPSKTSGPLDTWRAWCSGELTGAGIDAGHFIAEENPAETLRHLLPFLEKYAG